MIEGVNFVNNADLDDHRCSFGRIRREREID